MRKRGDLAPVGFLIALCAIGLLTGVIAAASADERAGLGELKPMLRIAWTERPEYPMGIQDSACGVLDGKFVSAGGFTRSPKDIVKVFPDAFGGQLSGFTRLTFLFDPQRPEAGWMRIADIPGPARQGAATAVVGNALYAIGGFNYTEPLTYGFTCRLTRKQGEWAWTELACPLPWPVCEASAAVIGSEIYLVGAADYFKSPGAQQADFHSEAGRGNSPVGRALLALDTSNLKAGWRRLADLPGTPRFDCAAAAAGGKLYVLGGIYSPLNKTGAYHNVVDSWAYDPATDKWARLPDMPDGANRRAVVFKDRYLILLAGFKYAKTWRLDGTQTEAYTPEEKRLPFKAFFEKTVLVYDTSTNRLGTANPLLDQTSWPGAAAHGDTIFCLGGEGGARLWHPATFQIGKVEEMVP